MNLRALVGAEVGPTWVTSNHQFFLNFKNISFGRYPIFIHSILHLLLHYFPTFKPLVHTDLFQIFCMQYSSINFTRKKNQNELLTDNSHL